MQLALNYVISLYQNLYLPMTGQDLASFVLLLLFICVSTSYSSSNTQNHMYGPFNAAAFI